MSTPALTPRRVWKIAKYRRLMRRMAGPKILRAFADRYPEPFFVEIGANDGDHHDHLRPFILERPWRGIMVEPVPYIFERLRANYGDIERVITENVAIAERDGQLPFYHLPEPDQDELERLPDWSDGIGSFSREAVLSHGRAIPDIENRIAEQHVPALTFESLCSRHGVSEVDLVLVDTEGYDWQILQSIDFDVYHPRLVIYEHYHLSPEDQAACRGHLEGAGYETMEEGFDTFCLDARSEDQLTRRWRRLRPAVSGVYAHQERA